MVTEQLAHHGWSVHGQGVDPIHNPDDRPTIDLFTGPPDASPLSVQTTHAIFRLDPGGLVSVWIQDGTGEPAIASIDLDLEQASALEEAIGQFRRRSLGGLT